MEITMFISKQVCELPEVGFCIVRQAESIDQQQRRLDAAQRDLDLLRAGFVAELKDNWTPEELVAAGLFA